MNRITLEVAPVSFFKRLTYCLKHISPSSVFLFLFVFFGNLMYFLNNSTFLRSERGICIFLVLSFIVFVLCFVVPDIYQAKRYIQKMEFTNENILITYYDYNTKKQMCVSRDFLRFVEYAKVKNNVSLFRIVYFDGKIYKKIIRQHLIGDWAKDENINELKKMIPPYQPN